MLFFAISVAFLAASLTESGLSASALVVALILAGLLTVASAYLKATTGASLEVEPVIQMLGSVSFTFPFSQLLISHCRADLFLSYPFAEGYVLPTSDS